jgi:leader peptidase (prepilin peptidase) / N-methyltransferase
VPLLGLLGAALGGAWGLLADRLAARWPEHEPDVVVPRAVDWRTPTVVAVGAISGGLVVLRFADQPVQLALLTLVVAALVVLFATDLDQKLLPDVLTFPLVPVALLAFVLAINPFVRGPNELLVAVIAAVAIPLGLFLLSLPFGPGAIGMGDLKLLLGVGLLVGASRLLLGLVIGALLAAATILVLIVIRRISLRSYVPYGPFLILGSLWAILVLADAG